MEPDKYSDQELGSLSSEVLWTVIALFYLGQVVYMTNFAPEPIGLTSEVLIRALARVMAGLAFGWLFAKAVRGIVSTKAFGGKKIDTATWTLIFAAILQINTEWWAATHW